jgi:GT2 family glycosyltransferase/glycosyltransferase involved in cell wall biosynthesis
MLSPGDDAFLKSDTEPTTERQKVSAVVISYNRVELIGTCLRALSFADELIVVDKSSTDGTAELAASLADRVIIVPWSPTVEETRSFAVGLCTHDWILCLDDDECLSVEAVQFLQDELKSPRADVYALPQRHHILGMHDENAYYWPEYQPRFFRRGGVELRPTVHGGIITRSDAIHIVSPDTGICIHHLSHESVSQWLEKTNRYTSNPDRLRADDGGYDLTAFAHARIDAWIAQTKSEDNGSYPVAVALLRAVYDMIDRLKTWEAEQGLDGKTAFQDRCRALEGEYARSLPSNRGGAPTMPLGLQKDISTTNVDDHDRAARKDLEQQVAGLRNSLLQVRAGFQSAQSDANETIERQRQTFEEERARYIEQNQRAEQDRLALAEALKVAQNEIHLSAARVGALKTRLEKAEADALIEADAARREADAARAALEQLDRIRTSKFWQATGPLRHSMDFVRRVVRRQSGRANLILRAAVQRDPYAQAILATALHRLLIRARLVRNSNDTGVTTPARWIQYLPPHEAAVASYTGWLARFDTPGSVDLERMATTEGHLPVVVFVVTVPVAASDLIERTVTALQTCIGIRWSAVFVFDAACDDATVTRYRAASQGDARFHSEDLPQLQNDTLVILLEAGAIPKAHGPCTLVTALARDTDCILAYSDEDQLGNRGKPEQPRFKPSFSRLLAEQGVLLGRMVALRPSDTDPDRLVRRMLELREAASAVVRDIALSADPARILHVPHVLFSNAISPPSPAALRSPPLPDPLPSASILIPTRNGWNLLGPCLQSLKNTDWPADRLEIIVVDNGSTDAEALDGLKSAERSGFIRILRDPRPFNYAQLCNAAAAASSGELLVFLNNDTEVIDPAWLRKLAGYAMQPDVGAVGPKLLYEDGSVQHAGVVLGIQGVAAHAHVGLAASDGGYRGLANLTHEVMAVTGACLAVKRSAFEECKGLDETFRIAFNDVVLCLDLHMSGRRNVYFAEPLFSHYESKTRGLDDTPEKKKVFHQEAQLAWKRHAALLRNDPFYSPNLSLETPYRLACAPRRRAAWRPPASRPLRIMMLSITHARGHGVAVVIDLQVRALLAHGHEVIVAGITSAGDFPYEGHKVLEVHDPRSAATLAADLEVDVIVAHTPPFFGVARWTGTYPPVLAYDYGEPPPEYFPKDTAARREVLDDKYFSLSMCTRVLAISDAVANESVIAPDGVVPLGNGHLGRWSPALDDRRQRIRSEHGWENLNIVLNVCRFHAGERAYKGIGHYADLRDELMISDPTLAARTIFVLCGKGDPKDVAAMESRGLRVFANVTDSEITDLYAAADIYANFSQWEGYNLGIGQALAMGLPVVASDIPAHRAFGVFVTNEMTEAARQIKKLVEEPPERAPRIWEWDVSLEKFISEIEALAMAEQP